MAKTKKKKTEKPERVAVLLRLSPETVELADELWEEWGYDSRHELLNDLIELGLTEYTKSTPSLRKKVVRELGQLLKQVESGELQLTA